MHFLEQRVDLETGPLHYLKGGDGPPILHMHSSGGPRVSPVTQRLAQRHTIYMPTVPGFNSTSAHPAVASMVDLADLMAEFVRAVNGGPCDVVSESFGGWIALWLAARHPELVEQLVLEAPAGLRTEGTGGLPADPAERLRRLHAVPERAPKETRTAQVLARNQEVRDGHTDGITLDTALEEALGRIKARTLILFGTADEVVPVETARRLKAGIAHSHLSFVYGAAHALEFDQPQRAARLIAAFLEHGEGFLVRRPGAA
jgi:pimeloyl-ACP methyl ester carboxylesterase